MLRLYRFGPVHAGKVVIFICYMMAAVTMLTITAQRLNTLCSKNVTTFLMISAHLNGEWQFHEKSHELSDGCLFGLSS